MEGDTTGDLAETARIEKIPREGHEGNGGGAGTGASRRRRGEAKPVMGRTGASLRSLLIMSYTSRDSNLRFLTTSPFSCSHAGQSRSMGNPTMGGPTRCLWSSRSMVALLG